MTEQTLLYLSSGFLRRRVCNTALIALGFMPLGALPGKAESRVLRASVASAEQPGLTVPPAVPRAHREDAQLLQLHEQLRSGHAQRHHPGHQRRVHPGRPLAPALVLRGQGHLLCPAARAQWLSMGLLSRCGPLQFLGFCCALGAAHCAS